MGEAARLDGEGILISDDEALEDADAVEACSELRIVEKPAIRRSGLLSGRNSSGRG